MKSAIKPESQQAICAIKLLKCTAVSLKTTVYRTVGRSAVMYGSQVRTLSKSDDNNLATLERKILRKIFGPLQENDVRRNHSNQGFMDLYTEPDTISGIRKGR
jgi:hypothetical protein